MNYHAIHDRLIVRARFRHLVGYCEKHHVKPKSISGSGDPSNIVALTAKEHFVVHHLLIKCYDGEAKKKMQLAFWMMFKRSPHTVRHVTSARTYAWARQQVSDARRGTRRTPETIAKMSAGAMGKAAWNKGIPQTKEVRQKLRAANLGKPSPAKGLRGYKHTPEAIAKIVAAGRRPCSPETRLKISLAQIGKPKPPTFGYKPTPETIAKLRRASQRPRGPLSQETRLKISLALKGRPKLRRVQNACP